jgi:hypothetical protein
MFAFIKRNKSDAKQIEFQYNKTINAVLVKYSRNAANLTLKQQNTANLALKRKIPIT